MKTLSLFSFLLLFGVGVPQLVFAAESGTSSETADALNRQGPEQQASESVKAQNIRAQGFVDPTAPVFMTAESVLTPAADVSSEETLLLQGIISGVNDTIAIINNNRVRQGDSFDGYTVVSISDYQVVLDKRANKTTLTLFGAMVKQYDTN